MSDPALMTLVEAAKAIAEKKLSSREITQSCLDRIAAWNPSHNIFVAVEAEAALAAADKADAELAAGSNRGRLHGVPMAHKDMFYEAGKNVTCGSLIRKNWVATTTATVLERLYAAGTIRTGSLQMVEFAYGPLGHNAHMGPVGNPWNKDHVTGGSSSGSGAAIAARVSYAALGSDTGGSIRMPAHYCGVTGLKTTVGLVSRAGAMPLSQSLDTVGPLAQTAEDCALITEIIAGADPADPTTLPNPVPQLVAATHRSAVGMTIGIPSSYYVDDLDEDVAAVLQQTIAIFKSEGINIKQVNLPDQDQMSAASQILLGAESAAFHLPWMRERPQDYGPQVLMRLQNGLAIPAVTYLEALRWRAVAMHAWISAVNGCDAILAPVSPVPAPTYAESDVGARPDAAAAIQRYTRFTRPVNYLGLPALSIPCGFSKNHLPIGLQLIGRPYEEAAVLCLGAAFQRATDFHTKRPELS